MHNLVLFVVFLAIIAFFGVYMLREPPYIQVVDSENVQLYNNPTVHTRMALPPIAAAPKGLLPRCKPLGANPKGVKTLVF